MHVNSRHSMCSRGPALDNNRCSPNTHPHVKLSFRLFAAHSLVPGSHQSTRFKVAAAATAGDSSTESVLESLREAFGAAPVAASSIHRQDLQPATPAGSVPGSTAQPSRRASSSSSSSGKVRGNARAAAQQATSEAAPDLSPKKRRGRFGDLITALEHELLHPEEASSSSSSSSSSDGKGSSSAGNSSTGSTNGGSSSNYHSAVPPLASPTAAGRSPLRRIRRGVASNQQQQQQQQQALQTPNQQQPRLAARQQELPPWLVQQQQQQQTGGGRRAKAYQPVSKGDLLLPGGPAWSGLRRHIVAAGCDPCLPTLGCIVVVEGDKDQQAVGRAVNAPVYVCDGTRALKDHVRPELSMLQQLGRTLVVLTDPDERGRELRCHLDDIMGPLHHAFVPEQQGTSDRDGPVHTAGNRGIEHVVPVGVQQALAAAAPSWPKDRAVWGLEDLHRMNLANAFDAGHEGVVRGPGGAAARRRQLCALLGLGRCTAAQLLSALNRFFSEEQLQAALQHLEAAEAASQTPAH